MIFASNHHESHRLLPHRVIRASAGTGKTYTLSGQFLSLLNQGAEPAGILVTTFTRKAAGQILGRILSRLAEAAADPALAARLGSEIMDRRFDQAAACRLLEQLCGSLHRLHIGTLDSFFYSVVRMFRLELGLPGQVRVLDPEDPAIVSIRHAAIGKMLAGRKKDVLLSLMQRLFHGAARRSISGWIDSTLQENSSLYNEAPQEHLWQKYPVPDQDLTADRLADLADRLEQLVEGSQPQLLKAVVPLAQQLRRGEIDDPFEKGLLKKAKDGDPTYYRKPIPDPLWEHLTEIKVKVLAEQLARCGRRVHAIWELLHAVQQQIDELHQSRGVLEFADLVRLLADHWAGREHQLDDLAYRLDARISHILLDEFQDTSVTQWRVLQPIAEEITSSLEAAGPVPRTLFCVGDMKQAIYGWRGGCAAIFNHLEESLNLPDSVRQSLNKCYRCSRIILRAVDDLFGDIDQNPAIKEEIGGFVSEWKSGYEQHEAAKPDQPGYVVIQTSSADDTDEADSDESAGEEGESSSGSNAHLLYCARYIADLYHKHQGRSIGVLVGSNECAKQLIALLRARRVQASGESGASVGDDPAVQLLLQVLRLADHPGDTTASWLLSRSCLAEYLGLAVEPGRLLPSSSATLRASRALRQRFARQGVAEVAAEIIAELRQRTRPELTARLDQLLVMMNRFDQDAETRLGQVADYLEQVALEEGGSASLRVMTVHKAKGLEFDVVVLPELHRKMDQVTKQMLLADRPDPTGPVMGVYDASNKGTRSLFPPAEQAYQQVLALRIADSLCGLYVAMTRARYALHMILRPIKHKKDGKPTTAGWSDASSAALLRRRFSTKDEDESPAGDQMLACFGDPDWDPSPPGAPASTTTPTTPGPRLIPTDPQLWKAPEGKRLQRGRLFFSPSSLEGKGIRRADDLLRIHQGGLEYGSVMHGWFEMIDFLDGPGELPSIETLIESGRRMIPGSTRSSDELEQMAGQFRGFFDKPEILAQFSRPQAEHELWRERRFVVTLEDGRIVRGQFDRVVLIKSNGRPTEARILDFKTDRVGPDGIAPLIDFYRPQMESYRRCIRQWFGPREPGDCPVSVHLLFTGIGHVAEVPSDAVPAGDEP